MSENNEQLKNILEGALLAAGEALSIQKLQSLFDEGDEPEKTQIQACLEDIKARCEGRGFDLVEVASGWRFQVREELSLWVNRLWEEKPQKYSRALLETLALIAYRQPITRGDIEEVRGVAVSSHIIKTLMERDWVKVVGHRDVPGRPSLYATTKSFLDYFGLKSLEELPTLGELKDIESLNQDLQFDELAEAPSEQESANSEVAVEDGSAPLLPEQDSGGDIDVVDKHEDAGASDNDLIEESGDELVKDPDMTPTKSEPHVHVSSPDDDQASPDDR